MRQWDGKRLSFLAMVVVLLGCGLYQAAVGLWHVWPQPEETLQFSELYAGGGARGLTLSPKLLALHGKQILMAGYMAPPLKPALDFFVLTRVQLSVCPFCASDAAWPEDIVFVRMPPGQTVHPTAAPVQVVGRLDIGTKTDAATGFVSLIRLEAQQVTVKR